MPVNPNYRLADAILSKDRETLLVMRDLTDYTPVNSKQSIESLVALEQTLRQTQEVRVRAQAALSAARAAEIEAGWEFHSTLIGAKSHIAAQYGNDSQVIQTIGLTKRSDRKRPTRRQPRAET